MLTQNPPFPFWSVWNYFSTFERLFLLALGILSIYVLFSAFVTASRLRKASAAINCGRNAAVERTFLALRRRSARVRGLIETAFYLFGIVLFLSLQHAHIIVDNSRTPLGWEILQNFEVHFVFAFNAFYVFLMLHLVAWFVAAWADKFAVKVNMPQLR
jgi:hypothetical protein